MNFIIIAVMILATGDIMSLQEYYLARAIQGERPDLVCPKLDECSGLPEKIGQVVLNRLDAGWCGSIQECVDSGFWGAREIALPDPWAVQAARNVLAADTTTDEFYVFSIHDVSKLELDLDDALYTAQGNGYALAFYGRDTDWRKETVK